MASLRDLKPKYKLQFYWHKSKTYYLPHVKIIGYACDWANKKGIQWTYVNVYDRKTGAFLFRVYQNNYSLYSKY